MLEQAANSRNACIRYGRKHGSDRCRNLADQPQTHPESCLRPYDTSSEPPSAPSNPTDRTNAQTRIRENPQRAFGSCSEIATSMQANYKVGMLSTHPGTG